MMIVVSAGDDGALETADGAVLKGPVLNVVLTVRLSRDIMANIRQNITIALGRKTVFLVTTILGGTGLWPAILADTGATVLVTTNAMRLLGGRRSGVKPSPWLPVAILVVGAAFTMLDAPGGMAHWALAQLRASYPANQHRTR
jgi:hypothetical protein